MKIKAFIVFMLLMLSLASGCIGGDGNNVSTTPAPTSSAPTSTPAPTTQAPTTTPTPTTSLKIGEKLTYEVTITVEDYPNDEELYDLQEVRSTLHIDVLPSDDYDYSFRYHGTINVNDDETIPFDESLDINEENLYGDLYLFQYNVLIQPMFMLSHFSPWVGEYMKDEGTLYVGSSLHVEIEGEIGTFDVVSGCGYLGIRGYLTKLLFTPNDVEYNYDVCNAVEVALPLALTFTYSTEDINYTYTSEIVGYETSG